MRFGMTILLTGLLPSAAAGLEHVEVRRGEQKFSLSGEIVIEAQDGGMMLRTRDGMLWRLPPDEILQRRSDESKFTPMTKDELGEQLLRELGDGFSIHTTANYVICYETSRAYAQWCGALHERLLKAFLTYWNSRGVELQSPEAPLAAVVFATRRNFQAYARRDLETDPGSIIGYYNLRTNRNVMYDLTELDARVGGRATTAARINQILMQPRAERTVATIVHEATHQLSYNTGLQERFADNPFWVSEGLAVYFETPDLRSTRGWRGIGSVNRVQLLQFRKFVARRPPDSLRTLLADDSRFRDPEQQGGAYAEAWALNYFLLKRHKEKYAEYLGQLGSKTPLIALSPEERLAEFTTVFGSLEALDSEFLRYLRTVR